MLLNFNLFLYICKKQNKMSHKEKQLKVYLAASMDNDKRDKMYEAINILRIKGLDVYAPVEHKITNAWDYPNDEWGLMVFQNDINAINESNFLVLLSWGRHSTAGANWEAGYAFGTGIKVIVVEMGMEPIEKDFGLLGRQIQETIVPPKEVPMSLMVANGRYATVKGLHGLEEYDFNNPTPTRTKTEQQ